MIVLTEWDMIKGIEEDDESFNEITKEDFIRELENNIGKNGYELKFDDNRRIFRIKFENKEYKLDIGYETIENYRAGIYNDFTYRLKKIVDKQNQLDLEKEKLIKQNNKNREIIKEADEGIIKDAYAQELYLKHIKEESKIKLSNLSQYFRNLFKDWKESFTDTSIFIDGKLPFGSYPLPIFHLAWIILNGAGQLITLFPTLFTNKISKSSIIAAGVLAIPNAIALGHTLISQVGYRVNRLNNYIEKNRSQKEKIKRIKNMKLDNASENILKNEEGLYQEDKSIEDIFKQSLLYKEFFDLVNLAQNLNQEEKIKYSQQIRILFEEYKNKTNVPSGYETLSFDIKTDIISRLTNIKMNIRQDLKQKEYNLVRTKASEIVEEGLNNLDYNQTNINMGQAFAQMRDTPKLKRKIV